MITLAPPDHREVEGVGQMELVRGDRRHAVLGVVHLPEVEQQLAAGDAEAAGHGAVGPHGPEPGDAVVDDHAEVPLQHLVDRAVEHVLDHLRAVPDQPAGHDVAGEHHWLALGGADPLDDQHVLAGLQLEAGRLGGGGGLHPVPPVGDPGPHPGRADGLGDAEVDVEAVGHAGALGHVGARALPAPQQPLLLQGPQRLAQGRPGDLELGREVGLGGEATASRQPALVDPLPELVGDRDRAQPRPGPGAAVCRLHRATQYTSDNSDRSKVLLLP